MTENDGRYDGRFWVGVHSTGIYCLPSCRARLPKIENVQFYPTREEAIASGLRGCRRCRSERFPDILPDWLHRALKYMQEHYDERLNEQKLMQMAGVNISTVRRYFKTHLNTTPLAFHRRVRLLHARRMIESGADYLEAAFACGYESASGFRDAFAKQFGSPPGNFYEQQ